MQGGTFTMGDFGTEVNGEYRRLGFNKNTQPHEVTLTSYSLAKYKVTWSDYDTFLLATGRPVQEMVNYGDPLGEQSWGENREPYQHTTQDKDNKELPNIYYYTKPASVQWQDAKDYCEWLGKELNLPIDLVTEAQWEYAARSGGYKVLYANAKGDINNPPTMRYLNEEPELKTYATFLAPVGALSTPNAAGFYDMDNNGREWVNDWYSETYYTDYLNITDPKGVQTGELKITRVLPVTFDRGVSKPTRFNGYRCAINSNKPVN